MMELEDNPPYWGSGQVQQQLAQLALTDQY